MITGLSAPLMGLLLGVAAVWSAPDSLRDEAGFVAACSKFESDAPEAQEEALAEFRRLLSEPGREAQDWFDVAGYLFSVKAWEACEPFAAELLRRRPASAEAHIILGVSYLYSDHPMQAEELFKKAVEQFPENAGMHYNYALSCTKNERDLVAQKHYTRALELKPEQPLFLFTAGQCARLLSRMDQAEDYFRRSAAAERPHPDAEWTLAVVCAEQGKDQAARRYFLAALEHTRGPSRVEAIVSFGVFHLERGRHELALRRFESATKLSPKHRVAWQYRARALRALGRMDEAREAVGRYREIQRENDSQEDAYLLSLLARQLGVGRPVPSDGGADESDQDGES